MKFRYILHEKAQEDYESSLKWYLARSYQAALGFVAEVEAILELICKDPTMWRNVYKHYYELGLKKYPFIIIYSIEEDKQLVVVSAIYHHKRNPKGKYRTLV